MEYAPQFLNHFFEQFCGDTICSKVFSGVLIGFISVFVLFYAFITPSLEMDRLRQKVELLEEQIIILYQDYINHTFEREKSAFIKPPPIPTQSKFYYFYIQFLLLIGPFSIGLYLGTLL